jgi:hypothetical protein
MKSADFEKRLGAPCIQHITPFLRSDVLADCYAQVPLGDQRGFTSEVLQCSNNTDITREVIVHRELLTIDVLLCC